MSGQARAIPASYLLAQACHFMAGGMMNVVFAWLIVHELHEKQVWVGVAQFFATLPMQVKDKLHLLSSPSYIQQLWQMASVLVNIFIIRSYNRRLVTQKL